MRQLILFLHLFVTLFFGFPADAALTNGDKQELSFKNLLGPFNGGFENGLASWVPSTAAHLTVATSGSNLLVGGGSGVWDAAASNDTLRSKAVTIPNGLYGLNCEASVLLLVPSGTATHSLQAYDGTNVLVSSTVVTGTSPKTNTVYFPCPTSGTIAIRLLANANEPALGVDEAYIGVARNIGNVANTTEWETFTPALTTSGGGSITLNSTGKTDPNGRKRRVGDSMEVQFSLKNGSGGAASGSAGSVQFGIPSECVPNTSKLATSVGGVRVDGSGNVGTTAFKGAETFISGQNILMQPEGASTYAAVSDIAANYYMTGRATIPCTGWGAEQSFRPEQTGWYVAANISGANPSLGVSAVTGYTEIIDAGLTMTPRNGSQPVGIMCSTTNAATTPTTSASTCAAGSESIGANFNIPVAGSYEVCASYAHQTQLDSGEALNATFQLIETPTNAQTLTLEGGGRVQSGATAETIASGVDHVQTTPNQNCSIFQWTSSGNKGVRLMYEQAVTGTPDTSVLLADAGSNNGQRDILITVKPVTPTMQAPILVGSVTSASTGAIKIESARVGSTGTVTQETGDWINGSVSVASAVFTMTLNSGFTSTPNCNVNILGETTSYNAVISSISTSSIVVRTFDTTNAAGAAAYSITCMGPR